MPLWLSTGNTRDSSIILKLYPQRSILRFLLRSFNAEFFWPLTTSSPMQFILTSQNRKLSYLTYSIPPQVMANLISERCGGWATGHPKGQAKRLLAKRTGWRLTSATSNIGMKSRSSRWVVRGELWNTILKSLGIFLSLGSWGSLGYVWHWGYKSKCTFPRRCWCLTATLNESAKQTW